MSGALTLLLGRSAAAGGTPAMIGSNTKTGTLALNPNYVLVTLVTNGASPFTLTDVCTICGNAPTVTIQGVVYSDVAGTPTALLANSSVVSATANVENALTLASPYVIGAGVSVWVGYRVRLNFLDCGTRTGAGKYWQDGGASPATTAPAASTYILDWCNFGRGTV